MEIDDIVITPEEFTWAWARKEIPANSEIQKLVPSRQQFVSIGGGWGCRVHHSWIC
jgi:hypothetical protein